MVPTLNPDTNQMIAEVVEGFVENYEEDIRSCAEAAKVWMQVPTPKRGEIVRQIGNALRNKLQQFRRLMALEMGKILPKRIGEVQNDYPSPEWLPLLQVIISRIGSEVEDTSLLFQLLSYVVEAENEEVISHLLCQH